MDEIIERDNGGGLSIDLDPRTVVVKEFGKTIRSFGNSVKEYKIAKEQEETRRTEIKAQMKVMLAEIDAKKEALLKYLDNRHEKDMAQIKLYGDLVMKSLDEFIDSVRDARECAKKENDFSQVILLLDKLNEYTDVKARFMLEQMDKVGALDSQVLPTFAIGTSKM